MEKLNAIGLETEKADELADKLNVLLSNYSLFYQNVRGYHWNIRGDKFFELHVKFEELYSDLQEKIDEIAERVVMLGDSPEHRFSGYAKMSAIEESQIVTDGMKAVENILKSLKSIMVLQREILSLSGDIDDEGTHALMSDYIRDQEKLIWMYSAYLYKK